MALASGCGVASDFDSVDSESLHIPRTASTFMDSRQHLHHDAFSLDADPYGEFDHVTRSFDPNSVADVAFKMIPSDDALGMIPSDDALAVLTGHEAAVNLGCNIKWHENLSHDVGAMGPIDDALVSWAEQIAAEDLDTPSERHSFPYSRRFQATKMPPGVPSNICFRLQPMTYWLRGVDAHVIANMLLDFLTAKVTTTIIKVSHAKFSIKVNICIDGSDCMVKLRMYSNNASCALVLELQRRSGCGMLFNRFYQEVGSYLAARQKSVQLELLNALKGGSCRN